MVIGLWAEVEAARGLPLSEVLNVYHLALIPLVLRLLHNLPRSLRSPAQGLVRQVRVSGRHAPVRVPKKGATTPAGMMR